MKRALSQYCRLLRVVELIKKGRTVEFDLYGSNKAYHNCVTMAGILGVTSKTIQRDVEYLKYSLDLAVEYDPIRMGYHLPDDSIGLTAGFATMADVTAILLAAVTLKKTFPELGARLEKLVQNVMEMPGQQVSAIERRLQGVTYLANVPLSVDDKILSKMVRAIAELRQLKVAMKTSPEEEQVFKPDRIQGGTDGTPVSVTGLFLGADGNSRNGSIVLEDIVSARLMADNGATDPIPAAEFGAGGGLPCDDAA